jgi:protein-arginine kinase activator protein McsA
MSEHRGCPNCESLTVEVVHTEWYTDAVERVKICEDCPAQWTVVYGNPFVKDVEIHD